MVRALGQSVRWRFRIAVRPEDWGEKEQQIVRQLADCLLQPCKVHCSLSGIGGGRLGPDVLVTGASRWAGDLTNRGELERSGSPQPSDRKASVHYIDVEADGTFVESAPDCFVPRRRVHRVADLKQLVSRLSHVARPVGALMTELERVRFPDDLQSSIVQDGVSDWQFIFHIFDQCRWLLGSKAKWVPLTLVGGADEARGSAGKWMMTPSSRRAYEAWGTVKQQERIIRFDDSADSDGKGDIQFGRLSGAGRVPLFPGGEVPCVADRRSSRRFDAARWMTWRNKDLPCFTVAGDMVWQIEDRLFIANADLGWESISHAVPKDAHVVGRESEQLPRPWVGLGRVNSTSKNGPWIKVRLPGFEKGNDLIEARIGTLYSGKNGRRGVNYVPENGTEVLLSWTGRFFDSIIAVGNARSEATEFASPSIHLEDQHTAQFADIHVVKIGQSTIDSALSLHVKQQTDIRSARPFDVKADGADLKMSGGIVYTGRGS